MNRTPIGRMADREAELRSLIPKPAAPARGLSEDEAYGEAHKEHSSHARDTHAPPTEVP